MDSHAITTAILTHPWQVLLSAVVLAHAARATLSGWSEGRKGGMPRKPIETPTPRRAA